MAKTIIDPKQQVDEFMDQLDHPLKAAIQKIREIILSVDQNIVEEVKWNAPSFRYGTDYIATFNLHVTQHVHLVFHNSRIVQIKSNMLEGKYKDRKMIFFVDLQAVKNAEVELQRIVTELLVLIEKFPTPPPDPTHQAK